MINFLKRSLRFRHFSMYGLAGFLSVYFVYHALSGNRGLWAMLKLRNDIEVAQNVLDGVRAERLAMEDRIHGLYSKSLNTDLLEEQARIQLGYAYPQEMVIYLKADDEK